MPNTGLSWTLLLVLLSACAGSSAGPGSEIPPVPVSQPQNIPAPSGEGPSSKTWQIVPTDDPAEYTSSIKTEIQQLTTQQTAQRDTSFLQTRYTVSLTRQSDLILIEGSVTAFSIQTGQRIGIDSLLSALPLYFKGQSSNHEINLESSTSNTSGNPSSSTITCGAPSQTTRSVVQRNIFVIPLEIRVGSTWQDSLSLTVCNGSLPLTVIDRKDYSVTGEADYRGAKVLAITRNERALFYGEGSQDQHRIIIRGETIGTGQLYADPSNGLLLNITANNKTTLSIETSGRVQQFLQVSREVTSRTN